MIEKYEYVEPVYDNKTKLWDNISMTAKISNEKIVINNKKIVNIPKHYFYVKDELGEYTSIFGDRLKKVDFTSYSYMWNSKKKFDYKDVFESNLKPIKRFMIDNVNIPMNKVPLNKLFWDIENDMSLDTINTTKPITAISTFSNKIMRYVGFVWRSDLNEGVKKFKANEYTINKETGEKCKYPVSIYIFNNEFDMLKEVMKFFDDIRPHLYLGWNSNFFDVPYFVRRCNLIGVKTDDMAMYGVEVVDNDYTKKTDIKMNGAYSFDMLEAYKKMTSNDLNSYKLNNVAKDILGDSKHEVELKDVWKKDVTSLMRYNLQDVRLLVDIDEHTSMVDFFDEKRRSVGCEWDDIFQNSKTVDTLFLRKAKELNIVLPDPKYGFNGEKFIGAYVSKPIAGKYKWVIVLDLASLYPNLIIQFNISPDTITDSMETDIIDLTKHKLPAFKTQKNKLGFVPQTIDTFQKMRKHYKKEMWKYPEGSIDYKIWDNKQFTFKGFINSIYGVLGYSKFRLYDRRLAEAITTMGQEVIKKTNEVIKSEGYRPIYNDTDSSYVEIEANNMEEVIEIGKKLRDKVNESYNDFVKSYGCEENTNLEIEFESVYRQLFIAGDSSGNGLKKRYAYEQVWKDGKESYKIGFKGFEVVRSNASKVTKDVQKKLFEILFDLNVGDKDKKPKFEKWLKTYKKELKEECKYSYFAIPQTIKQRLSDYKITNPQVRASEYSNQHFGTNIGIDTKIKIIYIKGITGKSVNGLRLPDIKEICFEDEKDFIETMEENNIVIDIDWNLMFDKLISDKINNIYKTLKWADIGQYTLDF